MEQEALENVSRAVKEDHKFELPAGFRFHPTDEELITHYLSQKVLDSHFSAIAIGEVNLNKCEPWDLPWMAKMGEEEWYFFCVKDRKYPTGLRTNRATEAGYWKATGKDRGIYKEEALIGMKKTLVFYMGRAPKGEKTNWVMHENRLGGIHSMNNLSAPNKNEWVICRVFQKSGSCGKKMHIPGLGRLSSLGKEPPPPTSLPPLMESSPYNSETKTAAEESSHVTCFSDPNQREDQKTLDDIVDSMETPILASSSSSKPSDISLVSKTFPKATPTVSHQSSQIAHQIGSSQYPDYSLIQEQSMLRMLIENHGSSTKPNQERDFAADISSVIYYHEMFNRLFVNHQELSSPAAGPVDNGRLWNY